MLIYKFKVISDEIDNFYREIEIKPGHTFKDFHDMLNDCIKFNPGEMASFYICDNKWNKLQEISLVNLEEQDESSRDADDNPENNVRPVKMMSEVKLKESINDPNQRLIYVYDFMKMYTFYIELSKITEGDEKITYPRCLKSAGDIQKPKKIIPKNEDMPESAEEFDELEEDLFSDDDTNFNEDELNPGDGFEENKYI
ncbi:MAG TPA: hypothetical protein PKW80_12925 [Bacteroidales bacterium]|nr:hypothetical protein [Bacteroidales bacterium]